MSPAPQTIASLEVANLVRNARKFLLKYGIDESNYTDDEVLEKIEELRSIEASNVEVLSRGEVNDQINLALSRVPKGIKGQFFRNTDSDIFRANALGWEVFLDEEASKASPTGAADGRVILGDSILMVIPEARYVAQRLGEEKKLQTSRDARKPKNQAESTKSDSSLIPIINLR